MLKLQTITDMDHRLVEPILSELETWNEPVAVALLPDHPTPCEFRTHTNEPVPFCIYYPGIEADSVEFFDEESAKEGSYGVLEGNQFINEFMRI